MFSRYFISCKAKGLSEQTITTYKEGLNFLKRFLDESEIELKDLTKEDVDDLILWLDNGKRSSRTIQSHMISIRTFLYYEMEQGRIEKEEHTIRQLNFLLFAIIFILIQTRNIVLKFLRLLNILIRSTAFAQTVKPSTQTFRDFKMIMDFRLSIVERMAITLKRKSLLHQNCALWLILYKPPTS